MYVSGNRSLPGCDHRDTAALDTLRKSRPSNRTARYLAPPMIPRRAHFIWFGEAFPWLNALALQSAHDHGEVETMVFTLNPRGL